MIIKQVNLLVPHKLILSRDVVLAFEYNDLPDCNYWFFRYQSSQNQLPPIKLVQGVNLLRAFNGLEFKSIVVLVDKVEYIKKDNLGDCVFFCELN